MKDKISDYSATANSNTDIGGINIDEGCAPSGINDAIRTLMKQLKDFQQGTNSDPFNGPHNGTVGATTPAAGAFTTLSASSTVSGTGFSTYLASPPAIGSTTANTGAFTTLSASSTVSGTGFSTYLASPPAIGGTVAAAGSFTTLSASSTLSVTGAGTIQGITVGRGAGAVATNTAVGASALANGSQSGVAQVAIGYNALNANTSGTWNTASGYYALTANTTGGYNVAIGASALTSNTTASNNTAVGYQAGYSQTTSTQGNVLVGSQAGYYNVTGGRNVCIGLNAGVGVTGNSYDGNVFIGHSAGASITTGSNNTFVGSRGTASGGGAGFEVTTGAKNTIIGQYSGNQGGLDIRTASNYIVLSDGDGNPRGWFNNIGNLIMGGDSSSARVLPQTDNAGYVGEAAHRWSAIYAVTGTIQTSDGNQKQDVEVLTEAEKRVAVTIKGLMRTYRFKDAVFAKGAAARIHIGVIAQDVKAAFEAEGLDPHRYALFCSDTWTDETTNEEVTRLGIRYDELLVFVIAAM